MEGVLFSPTLILPFKAMSPVKSGPIIHCSQVHMRHWSLDEWPVELLGKGSMDPIVYALWTPSC